MSNKNNFKKISLLTLIGIFSFMILIGLVLGLLETIIPIVRDEKIDIFRKGATGIYKYKRFTLLQGEIYIKGIGCGEQIDKLSSKGRIKVEVYCDEKIVKIKTTNINMDGIIESSVNKNNTYLRLVKFEIPHNYAGKELTIKIIVEEPFVELKKLQSKICLEIWPVVI